MNDVANRWVNGFAPKDVVDDESLFRTPSVTDSSGGARSEKQATERGQMVKTADQVVQLAFENGLKVSPAVTASLLPTPTAIQSRNATSGRQPDSQHHAGVTLHDLVFDGSLLPTPNTMEHREIKTPEQIAALRAKSPGGYRNLREIVINEMPEADLLPTPITGEAKHGDSPSEWNRNSPALGTMVHSTNWGKFEPAIRRWEQIFGHPAPAPTKPDGKDGAHRLSAEFTEWMMGLVPGWITGADISRAEALKAAGNGVVPQQAELALRQLLQGIDLTAGGGQIKMLPTPTVSDTYTANLKSTQQKPGSMHSVTLPQAINMITNVAPSD